MNLASFEPTLEQIQTRLNQGRTELLSKGREAARAASQRRAKFTEDANEFGKEARTRLAETVQKTLDALPVASKRDLDRLERKISRLQRKLKTLEKADPR